MEKEIKEEEFKEEPIKEENEEQKDSSEETIDLNDEKEIDEILENSEDKI